MIVKFDEPQNKYTIDMEGAVIVSKYPFLTNDPSMLECDCIASVEVVNAQYITPEDVTAWNLIFKKSVKDPINSQK